MDLTVESEVMGFIYSGNQDYQFGTSVWPEGSLSTGFSLKMIALQNKKRRK